MVPRRAGRPRLPDGRVLHVPSPPRRLRVVARRQVAAQARLSRRRPARRDVRRQRLDPAPVARAAVLHRRVADRRGEHARPPRSRAARSGRGSGDARGGKGGQPRRLPDGRALLRRDRFAQRGPVGRCHELRRVRDPRPLVVPRRRAPTGGPGGGPGRPADHRRARRRPRRLPRGHPVGGGRLPVRPPRQPRHGAPALAARRHRERSSGPRSASGVRRRARAPVRRRGGPRGRERRGRAADDAVGRGRLGPRAAGLRARARAAPHPVAGPPVGRVPGARGRRGLAGVPARHGRRAGDRRGRARAGGTRRGHPRRRPRGGGRRDGLRRGDQRGAGDGRGRPLQLPAMDAGAAIWTTA